MNEELLVTEERVGKYTVKVYYDDSGDGSNPREMDNLGHMVCFHKRYDLGDETEFKSSDFKGWDELHTALEKLGAVAILPLYLYDHSGITMNTTGFSCPWDSGQVGFIYATQEDVEGIWGSKKVTPELIDKELQKEVETYDSYIRGEIYCYFIEDNYGEVVESCFGYVGNINWCLQDGIDMAKNLIMQDLLDHKEACEDVMKVKKNTDDVKFVKK